MLNYRDLCVILNIFCITINMIHAVENVRETQKNRGDPADLTKMIYGYEADIKEFPFMVSLEVDTYHKCGGNLILYDWVLTAAHCVVNFAGDKFIEKDLRTFTVVAGLTKVQFVAEQPNPGHVRIRYPPNNVRRVAKLFYHPYMATRSTWGEDDVALIKLERKFDASDSIKTINLPRTTQALEVLKLSANAAIVGWGSQFNTPPDPRPRRVIRPSRRTRDASGPSGAVGLSAAVNGSKMTHAEWSQENTRWKRAGYIRPIHLRTTDVIIAERDVCVKLLSYFTTDRMICVDYPRKAHVCPGDSGGPLLVGGYPLGYLMGVASQNLGVRPNCGPPNMKTSYTRLDFYLDWIYMTVGPEKFDKEAVGPWPKEDARASNLAPRPTPRVVFRSSVQAAVVLFLASRWCWHV